MNSIPRSHSKSQVPVRCMRALGCAYRKLDSDRGSCGWWLDETTKYGTGRVTPNLLHNKPNLVHVIGAVAFEPISFSQPPHHSLSRVRACRRQDSRFQGSLRQEGAAQTKRPTQPKSSDDPPRSNNNNTSALSRSQNPPDAFCTTSSDGPSHSGGSAVPIRSFCTTCAYIPRPQHSCLPPPFPTRQTACAVTT